MAWLPRWAMAERGTAFYTSGRNLRGSVQRARDYLGQRSRTNRSRVFAARAARAVGSSETWYKVWRQEERMKALYATLLGAGALCAALAIAIPTRTMAQDDPALQAADHDFAAAVSKSDKAALDKLLDTDFVWIEANGKLQDHAQVLAGVPKRLIPVLIINGKPQFAPVRWHNYGEVAVAQTDEDRKNLVRIWVKRPAGWRALVYQEVESLGAAPKSTPSAGQQCDNPCKSVGYRPQNETEAAIIKAYERLETSAMTHNAADWDAHTGEEFAAASSFS